MRAYIFRSLFYLLRWWAQSFLGGIPRIICGFAEEDGIVRVIEEFQVKDIPYSFRVSN